MPSWIHWQRIHQKVQSMSWKVRERWSGTALGTARPHLESNHPANKTSSYALYPDFKKKVYIQEVYIQQCFKKTQSSVVLSIRTSSWWKVMATSLYFNQWSVTLLKTSACFKFYWSAGFIGHIILWGVFDSGISNRSLARN